MITIAWTVTDLNLPGTRSFLNVCMVIILPEQDRINHSGPGPHPNVGWGPFLIRVARIFSGRALF